MYTYRCSTTRTARRRQCCRRLRDRVIHQRAVGDDRHARPVNLRIPSAACILGGVRVEGGALHDKRFRAACQVHRAAVILLGDVARKVRVCDREGIGEGVGLLESPSVVSSSVLDELARLDPGHRQIIEENRAAVLRRIRRKVAADDRRVEVVVAHVEINRARLAVSRRVVLEQ